MHCTKGSVEKGHTIPTSCASSATSPVPIIPAATEQPLQFAPPPPFISQPGDERRLARDGLAYTYQQFIDYYGVYGNACWQAAKAPPPRRGTISEVDYELNLEGVKMYDSLMEAMIDSKYRDLCGKDLVNAYADDILQTEQRLQSPAEKGCRLLSERLQLLRQKLAELTRDDEEYAESSGEPDREESEYDEDDAEMDSDISWGEVHPDNEAFATDTTTASSGTPVPEDVRQDLVTWAMEAAAWAEALRTRDRDGNSGAGAINLRNTVP